VTAVDLQCPVPRCGTANEFAAAECTGCGTPLASYARVCAFPAKLFNLGLAAALDGRLAEARDLFAALVYWCPLDLEARNALAVACLELGDHEGARRHWKLVLSRRPDDTMAAEGLDRVGSGSGAG